MKIRITLTEEVLGSSPSNEELLAAYIASKAPTDDLTAQEVDNIKAQAAEERTTIFPRLPTERRSSTIIRSRACLRTAARPLPLPVRQAIRAASTVPR